MFKIYQITDGSESPDQRNGPWKSRGKGTISSRALRFLIKPRFLYQQICFIFQESRAVQVF
jgi:hypothetical protein